MAYPAVGERRAGDADLGTGYRVIQPIDGLQRKASASITCVSQTTELVRACACANEGKFGNDKEGI
jgi:hypothetical protein